MCLWASPDPLVRGMVIPVLVDGVHIAEVGSTEGRAGRGGEDEVEGGDEEGGAQQGLGTQVLLIQVRSFRYTAWVHTNVLGLARIHSNVQDSVTIRYITVFGTRIQ